MDILHFVKKQEVAAQVCIEGRTLIATYDAQRGEIQISNQQGQRVDSLQTDPIRQLLLASDESALLMLAQDGWLRVLDLDKGRTRSTMYNQSYTLKQEGGSSLALTNDKGLLAVGFGTSVQLYQIRTGKTPRPLQAFQFEAPVVAIHFADDGRGLRIATESAVVFLANNDD